MSKDKEGYNANYGENRLDDRGHCHELDFPLNRFAIILKNAVQEPSILLRMVIKASHAFRMVKVLELWVLYSSFFKDRGPATLFMSLTLHCWFHQLRARWA